MAETDECLGVCIEGRHLFYAVHHPEKACHLSHIGSIDFSFDLDEVLFGEDTSSSFGILKRSLSSLAEQYRPDSIRILVPARNECWSTFPRLVHEAADEREDHLNTLLNGRPRNEMETTWHTLSNRDFRLLMIRERRISDRLRDLTESIPQTEFASEFELALQWHLHSGERGEYLILCARENTLSITSSLLGQLRGATWLSLDRPGDLPFLWQWYGKELPWMNGFHDQVYICGARAQEIESRLRAILGQSSRIRRLDSLEKIQVHSNETTFGFSLESAFPAILLSLQPEVRQTTS